MIKTAFFKIAEGWCTAMDILNERTESEGLWWNLNGKREEKNRKAGISVKKWGHNK